MSRSVRVSILSLAVCLLTLTPFSFAGDFSGSVKAVPAANAKPLITARVDETRLTDSSISTPAKAMLFRDAGLVDPEMEISGQLLLKRSPEQQKALEELKARIGTPGDPIYGQTLTPKEFADTFGVAKSDIETISAWLQSHGIEVTGSSSGRLVISFKGTAAQIEEAFHTEIHNYLTPTGASHYAPAIPIRFPVALAPVVDRPVGLNSATAKTIAGYDGPVTDKGETFAPSAELTKSRGVEPGAGSMFDRLPVTASAHEFEPELATPTMALTVSPATIPLGGTTPPTMTATLTYTGGTVPTGTVVFSDADFLVYVAVNLSSCTPGTGKIVCTSTITDMAGYYGPDDLYAYYSGDSNFNAAVNGVGSTTLAETAATGTRALTAFSLAIMPGTQTPGTATAQSIVVKVGAGAAAGVPTGTVIVSGSEQLGTGNLFTSVLGTDPRCVLVTRTYTCTYPWTPAANTPQGSYNINASYSGSATIEGPYITTNGQNFNVINSTGSTTTTTIVANPPGVTAGAPGVTLTTVTSWTGGGSQPTGNLVIEASLYDEGGDAAGVTEEAAVIPYPAVGNTTTSGFGDYNSAGEFQVPFTFTYSCTTNTTALTITCVTNLQNVYAGEGVNNYAETLTAEYFGDATYKSSLATTTTTTSQNNYVLATDTTTPAPASVTYGSGASVVYTTTIIGSNAHGTVEGASYVLSGTPIGSPVSTTINTTGTTPCTINATYSVVCKNTIAVPAATPVGSYTVTQAFSGTTNYAPASTTTTVGVTAATPTAAASNESGGYESTVTLSATDTGVTGASAPTGTVTFTVNGVTVTGTPSCTSATDVETCTLSYTLPATLIAGPYPITAKFASDTNYNASNTAMATLTVSVDATSTTVAAVPNSINGSQSSTVTATVSNTTVPSATPTGGTVTFTDTTNSASLGSCTLSAGTCSIMVPGTSLASGANTISASYGGLSNEFGSSSGTTMLTLTGPPPCTPGSSVVCFTSVSHNFGQVAVGTAATTYGIQITNEDTAAYPFTLNFTPAHGFTSANNCGSSIAAGGKCELVFYFTPTATGPVSASWSLASEAGFGYNPANGGLLQGSGTSQGGVSVTTGGHNFGTVAVGMKSPTYGVELSNSTTSAVTLTKGMVSSPFASVTNCGATLAAGSSCELEFTFTPTTTSTVQQVYALSGSVTITAQGQPLPNGGITLTGN